MNILKLGVLLIMTAVMTAAAQAESEGQKYKRCMALSENAAEESLVLAREWVFAAGGSAARHCEAVSLLALGQAEDAATLLEKLIDDLDIGQGLGPQAMANRVRLKIDLYIQAAVAWKAVKNYDKAYSALSNALSGLNAKTVLAREIMLERGALEIIRKNYDTAIEDFTLVIEANETAYGGYLQRAKAYRKKKAYPQARLDLKEAFDKARDNPNILLESGILYRITGNKMQAKSEWNKIISLYGDSEIATLARENLALLEGE